MKYTLIILFLFLMIGCKKKHETPKGSVTFYQEQFMVRNSAIVIDGKAITVINSTKYYDSAGYTPKCGDNLYGYVVTVDLEYGHHIYQIKSAGDASDTFHIDVWSDCRVVKVGE
jgi:hypothetical protein